MSHPPPLRLPALAVRVSRAALLTVDGEIRTLTLEEARAALNEEPHLICHALSVSRALRIPLQQAQRHFDVLDLFAFARPARLALPTPSGLARAMGLPTPESVDDEALVLESISGLLLGELARLDIEPKARAANVAGALRTSGWPWAASIVASLGGVTTSGLAVWTHLADWEEQPPRGQPGANPVSSAETIARLDALLGRGSEDRETQRSYSELAAKAFAPRTADGQPQIVLAEAGTGTGKTIGYIAPASVWTEKNRGTVWISTFTKNLQRQVDQELSRLYPDPAVKSEKVVVRKGRENYLCLLNFQEAVGRLGFGLTREAIVIGLVARWLSATRDGDIIGGDFPPWLAAEASRLALTDRRGECVYSACPHYRKCFIERSIRKARKAEIVVANHALVMTQAARDLPSSDDDNKQRETRPRMIFDEGHHVFGAADSVFASHLTGREGAELRRWIRGREDGDRGRMRGLTERISDLLDSEDGTRLLDEAVRTAGALPGVGWPQRVAGSRGRGAMEVFLALVHQQVIARSEEGETEYGLECNVEPLIDGIDAAAGQLAAALSQLEKALGGLARLLRQRLVDEADTLETPTRLRIDALARGLEWRSQLVLTGWRAMLEGLSKETPKGFVEWLGVERESGRHLDTGMYRHFIDPTRPFAEVVLSRAHGALITSATLRDRPPADAEDENDDWRDAEMRTGATHLPLPALRGAFPSPFDYASQSRIFIVRDVNRRDVDAFAAAYRALFQASGGGALGLFTAIRTMRAVHARIAEPLDRAGIKLYGQHIDPYDMGLLVDMFRAEEDSCLLGTDAARDGVDVPGRSLRLIVFDRVPWPRPDIVHQARRVHFGGRGYDEMLTRFRLSQAFGRLIRSREDRGVFVILDTQTPTRLLTAFPPSTPIVRCGLAEAVAGTAAFLNGQVLARAASAD